MQNSYLKIIRRPPDLRSSEANLHPAGLCLTDTCYCGWWRSPRREKQVNYSSLKRRNERDGSPLLSAVIPEEIICRGSSTALLSEQCLKTPGWFSSAEHRRLGANNRGSVSGGAQTQAAHRKMELWVSADWKPGSAGQNPQNKHTHFRWDQAQLERGKTVFCDVQFISRKKRCFDKTQEQVKEQHPAGGYVMFTFWIEYIISNWAVCWLLSDKKSIFISINYPWTFTAHPEARGSCSPQSDSKCV